MDDKVFFVINGKPLYLDSYLVDFDIPIFYICRDDESAKYAVMCINSHADEYIIAKTSNERIKKMLENNLTLYDFMAEAAKKWHTIYDEDSDDDKIKVLESIDDAYLPQKGEFLNIYNKRISDYLQRINLEIRLNDLELQVQDAFQKYNFVSIIKKEICSCISNEISVLPNSYDSAFFVLKHCDVLPAKNAAAAY